MSRERYAEYLRSRHWQDRRQVAIRCADSRCYVCGETSYLNVHHLNYDHLWAEQDADLLVLCRRHHEAMHRGGIVNGPRPRHCLTTFCLRHRREDWDDGFGPFDMCYSANHDGDPMDAHGSSYACECSKSWECVNDFGALLAPFNDPVET